MGRAPRFLSSVLLLFGLASPLMAQSRTQNMPPASTMTQTGTTALDQARTNMTISSAPAAPGAASLSGTAGNCQNTQTYRFYVVWGNQSGWSSVGAVGPDYTPGTTNRMATVPIPAGVPSTAFYWRVLFRRSGDSFANLRMCNSTSGPWISTSTTTFDCACTATGGVWTNTNTSGAETLQEFRDGEIRIAGISTSTASNSASQGLPQFTEGQRRFRMSDAGPQWSSDSGVTYVPMMVPGTQSRVVCKSGCIYSTVQSALDSITDATSTKRYSIFIGPGDYDENVTVNKEFIDFVGMNRYTTRIRGNTGASGVTFTHTVDKSNVTYSNMTIGGTIGFGSNDGGGSTVRGPIGVFGCDVGIIDGSEGAVGKTTYSFAGRGTTDIYSVGNVFRATRSCVQSLGSSGNAAASSYYGSGNQCFIVAAGDAGVEAYVRQDEGADIYESAPFISITSASATALLAAFDGRPSPGFGDHAQAGDISYISMPNSRIVINTTNASRTGTAACFRVDQVNTSTSCTTFLNVDGSHCEIISSTSDTTSTLYGMEVTADTHHDLWAVRWVGGSIRLSGGATRTDFQNAETVGGFTLTAGELTHSGAYAGAGTTTTADLMRGAFSQRLIGRVGDLVAATCTPGEIALDTGGANKEICICDTGPAWACVTVTTATGPTN